MNTVQFNYAIDFYCNITKHSRFFYQEKSKAMNDAIMKKIDSITDTLKQNELNGLDRILKFRDELYTLLKPATLTITNVGAYNEFVNVKHGNYPTDYQTFAALTLTINGNTTYAKDNMDYNNRGPMLDCSFRRPNNKKPYMLEDATGLKIYLGDGTISNATLDYIKKPATFNMSVEENLIDAGTGVLAFTTTYIATEVSEYNSIQYQIGDEFTTNGVLSDLTSGQVIKKSLTTTTDLPEKCHDELAKMAAEILLGVTGDFNESAFAEKETK